MSANNSCSFIGNLTRDAELRTTSKGKSILTFGLAVNGRRKNDSTGEWEDVPAFFDMSMFGTRACSLASHLKKGDKVAVSCEARWSSWERDGRRASKVEFAVGDIEFLSSKRGAQQGREMTVDEQYDAIPTQLPAIDAPAGLAAEDIPF